MNTTSEEIFEIPSLEIVLISGSLVIGSGDLDGGETPLSTYSNDNGSF